MNIGLEITNKAVSLAYGGEAIIKHEAVTGFVFGALPGELVKSRVTEIKKSYFRSTLLEIIEPSPHRVMPPCPYFNRCGGCVYQHLAYEKQLEAKKNQLEDLLKHTGRIQNPPAPKIIPSPQQYNYRNQITLKLKSSSNGANLCFIGTDNKSFIPIEKCIIAKDAINVKIQEIKSELNKSLKIKNIKGEILIKCGGDNTIDYAFSESISEKGEYKLLTETIDAKTFFFSLASFFQTNPSILPPILLKLKDILKPKLEDTLFDLYSGTGLFSIYFSALFKNVYGIESNANAVKLADKSARKNNIKNCKFFKGAAEDLFSEIYKNQNGRNYFIVDPPRSGLTKKALQYLKEFSIQKLIYISCEPSILARDLNLLTTNGYQIEDLILADMFPQTKHMETLAVLSR